MVALGKKINLRPFFKALPLLVRMVWLLTFEAEEFEKSGYIEKIKSHDHGIYCSQHRETRQRYPL